ncbi:MAG: hypothetical protein AB7E37_06860 [Candidatus Altimarinota bacterium]
MRKSVILFSQSPLDISYVLYLYEKYKYKYNIKIFVVSVYNNYKFLSSLNLEVQELKFIPFISIKNPFKAFVYSFKLKFVYYKYFQKEVNSKVYFFSDNSDYITSFFINKLSKKNKILFVDIFNIYGEKISNIKLYLIKLIAKILFGVDIEFFKIVNKISYKYKFNKFNKIKINLDKSKLNHYLYNIKCENNSKKNILFIESKIPDGIFRNYDKDLINCMNKIIKEYNIYIKPHPRLGYSKIIDNYNVKIIDNYIPAEFIDIKSFDMIFGIISSSISTIEHKNKISLINFFSFIDEKQKLFYKDYLIKKQISEINFIEKYDFEKIIEKDRKDNEN